MMKRFSCAGEFGTRTGFGLPSQEVWSETAPAPRSCGFAWYKSLF